MQLKDLKPAWKQFKFLNTMHPVDSKEILSIIEATEVTHKVKMQRVLLNMMIFIMLTISCQGG